MWGDREHPGKRLIALRVNLFKFPMRKTGPGAAGPRGCVTFHFPWFTRGRSSAQEIIGFCDRQPNLAKETREADWSGQGSYSHQMWFMYKGTVLGNRV
jgi:hypothetical protein